MTWAGIGGALLFGTAVAALKNPGWLLAIALTGIVALRSACSFHAIGAAENEDWHGLYQWTRLEEASEGKPIATILLATHAPLTMAFYSRHDAGIPNWFVWDPERRGVLSNRYGGWRDPEERPAYEWQITNVIVAKPEAIDGAVQHALTSNGWTFAGRTQRKQVDIYRYRCPRGCLLPYAWNE